MDDQDPSLLTRCGSPTRDEYLPSLLPVAPTDDKPACRSPVSPSPSNTSTTSTTTTNASQTPSIVCRQADEVSSSPSSPTNSYGRLPFSRPIKNPSELDKKVRVVEKNPAEHNTRRKASIFTHSNYSGFSCVGGFCETIPSFFLEHHLICWPPP